MQQFNYSPYSRVAYSDKTPQEEHPLFVLIQNGIDIVLVKQLPVAFIYSLFTAQIKGMQDYIVATNLSEDKKSEFIEEAFEMFWIMIKD